MGPQSSLGRRREILDCIWRHCRYGPLVSQVLLQSPHYICIGIDMGYAFLVHLVGEDVANRIRGVAEVGIRQQGDDEFAEIYGLV